MYTYTSMYVNKIVVEKHKSEGKLEEEKEKEIERKRRKRRRNNTVRDEVVGVCVYVYT